MDAHGVPQAHSNVKDRQLMHLSVGIHCLGHSNIRIQLGSRQTGCQKGFHSRLIGSLLVL